MTGARNERAALGQAQVLSHDLAGDFAASEAVGTIKLTTIGPELRSCISSELRLGDDSGSSAIARCLQAQGEAPMEGSPKSGSAA